MTCPLGPKAAQPCPQKLHYRRNPLVCKIRQFDDWWNASMDTWIESKHIDDYVHWMRNFWLSYINYKRNKIKQRRTHLQFELVYGSFFLYSPLSANSGNGCPIPSRIQNKSILTRTFHENVQHGLWMVPRCYLRHSKEKLNVLLEIYYWLSISTFSSE